MMNNRFWLIIVCFLMVIGGYYLHKNLSLKEYYETEYWWALTHSKEGQLEANLRKIESDMRNDGYDARQISNTKRAGACMAD